MSTTTRTTAVHEHQSDDDYSKRLMVAHPRLGDAVERVAHQAAPKRKIKNPDQALLSAASAADVNRMREALRNGANPSSIETTSRSIGMHGRIQGPQRSALQLALLARGKMWVDAAHLLIEAGADVHYQNRFGERAEKLLRERLARARLPERNVRLFADYVLARILRPTKIRHWFEKASSDLFAKVRGERT